VQETFLTIQEIVAILNRLGIPYLIGGSVASSVYGIARHTSDVDFVVQIKLGDIPLFMEAVKTDYYADDEMIAEAIHTGTSFSLLHLTRLVKLDMFIKQNTAWAEEAWKRRQQGFLEANGEALPVNLPSPEDMVLQKLRWFQMGGGVSDRQWSDILGMLKVQGERLDRAYLRHWAADLGLTERLEQALSASGT
jgi:hypothetical protein